ncbi:MAG: bifunctional diguanylate cyclase/phosphodiesterase [Acidimicrobiales bacterium]
MRWSRLGAEHPDIGNGVDRRELNVIFAARHLVVIAFQLLSYFGRSRALPWWEPIVDFALVLPYSFGAHWAALRKGQMPGWVPIVDAGIMLAWIMAEPTSSTSLLAMMVATLTIAGQSVERRWLWTGYGISVSGLVVAVGVTHGSVTIVDASRFAALGAGVLTTVTVVRSARLAAQREQQHRALHDQLTGLANRTLLRERVVEAPADASLALLLLDLNNFKEVNDALGHHVGDELLVTVSRRICEVVDDHATVARLGGDEFAVSVPRCGRSKAVELADRITGALRDAFVVDGLTIEVGASIGIALRTAAEADVVDAELLIRHADVAMYQAKKAGRPFRVYDSSDDRSSVRRVTLLGELRAAIADDQLEVWYQPGLDLSSGRLNCMEALVRWRHPRHGLLLPDEFIELAEISGAIDELTRWVIDRAVRDTHTLSALGCDMLVSCNLSVRNLHDRGLIDWLEGLIGEVGLPGAGLYLELTESQLMEDPQGAARVLQRLAGMGVGAAIDDFGTGYSSMSMLLHVRASVLKIDQSFVADLLSVREAAVMVRSMIDLGHNLGLLVVAEGVEDAATAARLSQMGCDFLQGFHVARPMPFDQLVPLLVANLPECATG